MLESAAMKPRRFELAVLLLFSVIIGYQLFVPPLLGMADNGDFARLFRQSGLLAMPAEYDGKFFRYFNSRYVIVARPGPGGYKSSSVLPVRAARWFNIHFIDNQVFDVRVLGALHLAAFLFGVYLILMSSRKLPMRWRIPLAALLLLMFTDPVYAAYFNSFYSEATGLVCLVMIAGCSVVLIAGESRRAILLVGYFIAVAILVTAKPMYTPFALIFGPLGVYLSKLISLKHRYWLSGILACALLPLAAAYYIQTPNWLRQNVNYIAIFTVLLKDSPTAEQDLRDLELDPEWIRYAGTTPYQKDSPASNDAGFRAEFTDRVGTLTVPKFLLTHPARFYSVASQAARKSLTTRSPYGYYEASSGKPPYAKPRAPWSDARSWLFPASIWLLVVYFSTGAVALGLGILRKLSDIQRGLLLLYSVLVAFGAIGFFVPVLTMASIEDRYSTTFASAFDMSVLLVIGGLLGCRWKRSQLAAPQPEPLSPSP
ncbi:MAG TPA: hypothetical protein VJH03_10165 [Blastocatellia bacterium]|nr:hypothetical protein [Blastocatellia bacterium]